MAKSIDSRVAYEKVLELTQGNDGWYYLYHGGVCIDQSEDLNFMYGRFNTY